MKLIDSHAINDQIEEITFTDSFIETINPFGFTILKSSALLLKMENVQINRIESQVNRYHMLFNHIYYIILMFKKTVINFNYHTDH